MKLHTTGAEAKLDPFIAEVRKHFGYLVAEFGFTLTKEEAPGYFDNRLVQFESRSVMIRIIRDRGSILIAVAPSRPVADSFGVVGEWYGVGSVMAAIAQPVGCCDYRIDPGRLGDTVAEIATNFRKYVSAILDLFQGEKLGEVLRKLAILRTKPFRP